VITSEIDESVREAAKKMARYKIGSVVVTEKGKPIGIVTESDIVRKVVAEDLKPSRVKVGEIASKPLHTIDAGSDVTEAAKTMRKLNIKKLGVVYKNELVGIITTSDLNAVTPELVGLLSEKVRITTGESLRVKSPVAGYCDSCGEWSDTLIEIDSRFLCEDCRSEVSQEPAELPSEE
jgi:signal-transduction protein with cAMP-binding, CBS, and nucleotidyltransferase domain